MEDPFPATCSNRKGNCQISPQFCAKRFIKAHKKTLAISDISFSACLNCETGKLACSITSVKVSSSQNDKGRISSYLTMRKGRKLKSSLFSRHTVVPIEQVRELMEVY